MAWGPEDGCLRQMDTPCAKQSMPHVTFELGREKLQELLFQLPPEDFLALAEGIQERAETMMMMRLSETGFREWNDEGEDIYEAEPETP